MPAATWPTRPCSSISTPTSRRPAFTTTACARSPSSSEPLSRGLAALEPRQQLGSRLVDLLELVAAGEAQGEVAGAGVDPALQPLRAAFDRPRVRRLPRQDRSRR